MTHEKRSRSAGATSTPTSTSTTPSTSRTSRSAATSGWSARSATGDALGLRPRARRDRLPPRAPARGRGGRRLAAGSSGSARRASAARAAPDAATASSPAEAEAVLVARDRDTGRSRPLTRGERAAFERAAVGCRGHDRPRASRPRSASSRTRSARFVEARGLPARGADRRARRDRRGRDRRRSARRRATPGSRYSTCPAEHGGADLSMLAQVALEEESGKATNGLGFIVVERGPRELFELATPEQLERYVGPIARGEYREAWAITEPGAGSDVAALAATATRDGDDWVLNGEKWFVTSEGQPRRLHRARGRRRRADALPRRSRTRPGSRSSARRASCTTRTSTTTSRSSRGLPRARGEPRPRRRRRGREGVVRRRAALHRRPLLRRGAPARRPHARTGRRSARRSARRSPSTRASRSRSPTRSPSSPPRGSSRTTRRTRSTPLADHKIVHGKVVDGEALRFRDGRTRGRPGGAGSSAAAAT